MFDSLALLYRAYRYRYKLDRYEIDFLLNSIKTGDITVDIGAHKGGYTYWMRKKTGRQGKVIAFEPQKLLYEQLVSYFPQNCNTNVIVENKAVSDKKGTLPFFIPHGKNHTSPGATLEAFKANEAETTYEVSVTTLDEYFAEHKLPAPSLIKCDVEGHELNVFRGAENILKSYHPALLFECEQRHHPNGSVDEVFNYLKSLDYEGFFFLNGKETPVVNFSVEMYQSDNSECYINNFIFLKREVFRSMF